MADDKPGTAKVAPKDDESSKGGFIVTQTGEVTPAEVQGGRILGWNPKKHAHFTRDAERAARLAAIRKGATP